MDPRTVTGRSFGVPSSTYANVTRTETLEMEGAPTGAYGGASWAKFMPWYWLIWILLIPIFIYVILQAFPPCWATETTPSGHTVVSNVKTLGISIFVGWLIVLIFWVICRFAL